MADEDDAKITHMDEGLKRYFAEFFPDKEYDENGQGFKYVDVKNKISNNY